MEESRPEEEVAVMESRRSSSFSDTSLSPSEILRDLVSGDGSASVSIEQWEVFLEAIETRTKATMASIQNVLVGHHPEYSGTFACSQQVSVQLAKLRQDLDKALENASSENSPDGNAMVYANEKNRIFEELQRLEGLMGVLQGLDEIQRCFEKLDALLDKNQLEQGAKQVELAEEKLDELLRNAEEFVESKVYRAIRIQIRRKKAKLVSQSERVVNVALVIGSLEISVKSMDGRRDQTSLGQALRALATLGALRSTLSGNFSRNLLTKVVLPIAGDPGLRVDIENNTCSVVRRESQNHKKTNVFDNLAQVFHFISGSILEENADWMSLLAAAIWGQVDTTQKNRFVANRSKPATPENLSQALLQLLVDSLPEEVSGLALYQSISQRAKHFEDDLVELGLVPSTMLVLSPFLDDVQMHLAQKRRSSLLHEVREFVLSDYHSELQVGSKETVDGLLQLEKMRVSECAKRTLDCVYSALEEAVHSSLETTGEEGLCQVMYNTARDSLELFRALVPIVHKTLLNSQEGLCTGLLFHNDCLYFAHHLLLLAHKYRSKMPPALQDQVVTVDLVPVFRESANKILKSHINMQIKSMTESCLVAGKEDEPVIEVLIDRVKRCENALIVLTTELSRSLPVSVLRRTLHTVGNAVVGKVIDFITMYKQNQAATMMMNEKLSLRQIIQNFKEKVIELTVTDTKDVSKSVPNLLALTQLCASLDYISYQVYNDMVSEGQLNALSLVQVKGLGKFLFPGEEN
uniref:Uncharacterized protein n=1 Tax=Mucochytrium quahogii TaxID=96639 RepID=A0A7S2RGH5_9STRA